MPSLARSELPIDTVSFARYLIGKLVVRELPEGVASGLVVETEAYVVGDTARHTTTVSFSGSASSAGRLLKRRPQGLRTTPSGSGRAAAAGRADFVIALAVRHRAPLCRFGACIYSLSVLLCQLKIREIIATTCGASRREPKVRYIDWTVSRLPGKGRDPSRP